MRYESYKEIPNDKDTYEAQIVAELGFLKLNKVFLTD